MNADFNFIPLNSSSASAANALLPPLPPLYHHSAEWLDPNPNPATNSANNFVPNTTASTHISELKQIFSNYENSFMNFAATFYQQQQQPAANNNPRVHINHWFCPFANSTPLPHQQLPPSSTNMHRFTSQQLSDVPSSSQNLSNGGITEHWTESRRRKSENVNIDFPAEGILKKNKSEQVPAKRVHLNRELRSLIGNADVFMSYERTNKESSNESDSFHSLDELGTRPRPPLTPPPRARAMPNSQFVVSEDSNQSSSSSCDVSKNLFQLLEDDEESDRLGRASVDSDIEFLFEDTDLRQPQNENKANDAVATMVISEGTIHSLIVDSGPEMAARRLHEHLAKFKRLFNKQERGQRFLERMNNGLKSDMAKVQLNLESAERKEKARDLREDAMRTRIDAMEAQLLAKGAAMAKQESDLDQLQGEHHRLERETQCIICWESKRETLFLPCCHFICCKKCASFTQECSLCRGSLQGKIDVFQS